MILHQTKKLDERQLLIRGSIFKHGLFLMTILIVCNSMLNILFNFAWAPGKWPELTIVLLTIAMCCIELIYYDIYPLTEKRQRYVIYFMGVYGAASMGLCLYEMAFEGIPIVTEGKLTPNSLGILYGGMFLAIFIAYICRRIRNKKMEMEE